MNESEKLNTLIEILDDSIDISPEAVTQYGFYRKNISFYFKSRGLSDYNLEQTGTESFSQNYTVIFQQFMNRIKNLKEMIPNFEEFVLSINERKSTQQFHDNFRDLSTNNHLNNDLEYYKGNYTEKFTAEDIQLQVQRIVDEWKYYTNDNNLKDKLIPNFKKINKLIDKLDILDELSPIYEEFIETFDKIDKLANAYNNAKFYTEILNDEKVIVENKNFLTIDRDIINGKKIDTRIIEAIEPARIELHDYINNPERLFNQPRFNKKLPEIYQELGVSHLINEITSEMSIMYNTVIQQPVDKSLTDAEAFVRAQLKQQSNPLVAFLDNKQVNQSILFELSFDQHVKHPKVYFFNDNSIVFKNNKEEYKIPFNNKEATPLIIETLNNIIDLKLRKSPYISKFFKSEIKSNYLNIKQCITAINTYVNNEAILKANKFNIIDHKNPDYIYTDFESLDDKMNLVITNHLNRQYAHSIASSKYKHLYDDESYKVIAEIKDLGVESKILQDLIGKKLAAFKTPQDFNTALVKLLNNFSNFTSVKILEKAKDNNIEVISQENNVIVLKIENFNQSKELGSSSWCITRENHYFQSYSKNNHQYFVYDLNKNSIDNDSIIGITLDPHGLYKASHFKNDNSVGEKNSKDLQLLIVQKDKKNYPIIDSSLTELLIKKQIKIQLNP